MQLHAQHNRVLNGYVLQKNGLRSALDHALVTLYPGEELTTTQADGHFRFADLPPGNYRIVVSATGYVSVETDIKIPATDTVYILLEERIVGLKEVKVTAGARKLGSSSVIDRSAIIHTQPMSLADVLQLVPGQLAVNPSLGSAQQINLRQAASTSDAARANALGTQLIIDGVPISNNANLQNDVGILNSSPGALPAFSSVSGRGNDLRQIPADNIESVEVIRGIPSARFGDLTSGIVIVNSRIGVFKPEIRSRINPNAIQLSLNAGMRAKKKSDTYSIGADLLRARNDVRDPFNEYTRLQAQLAWQRTWDRQKKLTTTTFLSGYQTVDKLKQNPDDKRYQSKHYSDESSIRFSTQGQWKAELNWLNTLRYTASVTRGRQESYYQSLITRDVYPLSTAITDTTMVGVYGQSEYLNQTTVDGRPLNIYLNAEASAIKTLGISRHRFVAGVEWRRDQNTGKGRLFDPLTPPRQNYSMGDRPRSYREIPALDQLAYFLEDRISASIGSGNIVVQAGVRIDNLAPVTPLKSKYKTIVSPRINISSDLAAGISIRAGYGIAAKMPTLNYLYPGIRYFDLVNFNYYATNPAERLVVITTRTIDLNNQMLDPYISKKWEAGFDLQRKNGIASVTLFREITTGAIGTNRVVTPMVYERLQATTTPPGQPPVLDPTPVRIDTFFAAYDIPVNNRFIRNDGVEFAISLPEITAIRTSFNISGALLRTESFDDGAYMDAARAYQSTTVPNRIPVYESATKLTSSRFNTSIRLIHRIPELNIVVSGLWQTIWFTSNRPGSLNAYPIAYLNRKGEMVSLSASEAKAPDYADLVRPVNNLSATRLPALHLFNIRLTKEWRKGFGLSFYANNFINHRPLHTDSYTGGLVRRNEPLFFGAEFNITIK